MSSKAPYIVLFAAFFVANVESMLNGIDAQEGQFPYMVSLINRELKLHMCGGAIIDERHIISDGFCLDKYSTAPEKLIAHVGAWKTSDKSQSEIEKIFVHPDFDSATKRNDIAIVRLANEIIFTDQIQPIALPIKNFPNEDEIELIVSGFGSTFAPESLFEMRARVHTLQYQKTSSITLEECITEYSRERDALTRFPALKELGTKSICTLNEEGTCVGDRGSPLISNGTLVGIASWCVKCVSFYPSVYTNVYSHIEWIKEIQAIVD